MRVGLIGCCAEKGPEAAPARELYRSRLFRSAMGWISKPGRVNEWAILSAKHGLVMPDDMIDPYDVALSSLTADERRDWEAMVREQLLARWGGNAIFMVLAGADYRAALRGLPYVEDVIAHWTQQRRDRGMIPRRAAMGIGLIVKACNEGRGYY